MNANADITNVVNPYLTDVGVGLVFGLGYYLIKYIYGDNKPNNGLKTLDGTGKQSQFQWENAKTIEEFNSLIKKSEEESKVNPFEILDKIQKQQLTPDITTYNNLLNSCYVNGSFESADKLVEEIFGFGSPVQPDLSTFNILLKGISCRMDAQTSEQEKKNLVENMEKILMDIEKREGLKANDVTINTCLDILIKAGQINKAWEMFDSMQQKYEIEPDKYSYSTIIKALRFEMDPEKLEKAFGILECLKKKNGTVSNDEIIFNCLIDVCLKLNLIDKAERVFNEMKEIGVAPSKITYAIMIKGYGQVYNLDKAFEIFEEMKLANIPANEIIYGCLLNACVRSSKIDKLTQVYTEMKEKNLDMNIVLYTTLIKAYTKAKNLQQALQVYENMLNDENVSDNIVVHNAMLDCCVECNDISKMSQIYENVKEKAINDEKNPHPDLITYSTVIKGYARSKDMDKVFDIYNFLNSRNDLKMDEVIYNSILDGCAKTGNLEKALSIYEDMNKNNIKKSNVTYSILVKLYANNKMHEKALQVHQEMITQNIRPGIIVYTCLIQTCLRNKQFEKAIELFESLKADKLRPDHVLYNTVVNGCLYNQKWELACKYSLESFENNVKMAYDIYRSVLEKLTMNYCNLKTNLKCDYATKILKELKNRGIDIDDETYQKVARMVFKNQGIKLNLFANSGENKQSNCNNNNNGYKSYNNFNSQDNYKRDDTKDQLKWQRKSNK